MALIGITCNNNDTVGATSKIGRTPPFIDAIIKAFSFAEDTCIFDYADYCSITIPIDYVSAVGYGRVTFNEGFGIIKGRAFYIEQGTTFDVPLTTTTGGSIGIKVDLTKSAGLEFAFYSKTTQTLTQDDLIENRATGVYEFEIYKYTCANNVITLGTQIDLRIIKLKDYLNGANFTTQTFGDNTKKIATTEFVGNEFNGLITSADATDISHSVSATASLKLSDISVWNSIDDRIDFKKKFIIANKLVVYTGLINNPSGITNNFWYKIILPNDYTGKRKTIIPTTVYNELSNLLVYTNFTTYENENNFYIGRNSFSDRPNLSYTIIIYMD